MPTSIASRRPAGATPWRVLPALLTVLALLASSPSAARADDVTEAGVLFQRGNEHFQRGMRLRGERRERELEAALTQYLQSLARVRSRNVVYNTALVLEALERAPDAFNHWVEYLGVEGLSDAERDDGRAHLEALRPRVAVAELSTNVTAQVWIDRRDLGARGRTPLEIALPAGEHTYFFSAPGHHDAEARGMVELGRSSAVRVTLLPLPISLQVIAAEGARVELDGEPVASGQALSVPPGPHVVRVSVEGHQVAERRFEAMAGSAPMVLDLSGAVGVSSRAGGPVEIASNAEAQVEIDGVIVGRGHSVTAMLEPGPHSLRVSAEGHGAYVGQHSLTQVPARLDVQLAPASDVAIHALRGVFGGLALVGAGVGTWALLTANEAREANQREGTLQSVDRLTGATLGVDVTWSITAALGGLAVLFLVLDAGGGDSTATLSLSPTPGGATLALRGTFGGVR